MYLRKTHHSIWKYLSYTFDIHNDMRHEEASLPPPFVVTLDYANREVGYKKSNGPWSWVGQNNSSSVKT
jgi:hypothetical protein